MCTKELLIEALNEFPDIHRRLHRQALHEQAEVDAASAGQDAKDAPRAPFLRRSSSMYSEQSLEPPEGYDRTDSPPRKGGGGRGRRVPEEEQAGRVPGGGAARGHGRRARSRRGRRRAGASPSPTSKLKGMFGGAAAGASKLAAPASPAMKKLSGLFGKAASPKTPTSPKATLRAYSIAAMFSRRNKEEPKLLPANVTWKELWKTKRIFHPEAPYKIAWDLFVAMLIVLSVLIATYRLGFEVELGNGNENSLGIPTATAAARGAGMRASGPSWTM